MTADKPVHPALRRNGTGITADGEFHMPTRVLFGRGVSRQVAEHVVALGGGPVLLVTDPGVRAAGLLTDVQAVLEARGVEAHVFEQVRPNPRDLDCLAGADLARAAGIRVLVAVGGGSAIDSAKCIALLLTNGGHPRDWEDFGALRDDPLPTIAIPTTPIPTAPIIPATASAIKDRRFNVVCNGRPLSSSSACALTPTARKNAASAATSRST